MHSTTRAANLHNPWLLVSTIFMTLAFAAAQIRAEQPLAHEFFKQGTTERGFPYMSGGVGSGEREQMSKQSDQYNLKLVFAEDVGVYLADIRVLIRDQSGKELVNTVSGGPWFFLQLPPGRYDIEASFNGKTKRIHNLQVSQGQRVARTLHWDVPVEAATLEFAKGDQSYEGR
jgi:hypothetical protein